MAEVIIKKTYIVNCKTCGTTLRISGKSEIYMCPTCRKLFTVPAQKQEEQTAEVAEKVTTPITISTTSAPASQTAEQPVNEVENSVAPAEESAKTPEESGEKAEGGEEPETEEDDEYWSL